MLIINCSIEAEDEVEASMTALFAGKALMRVHNVSLEGNASEYIYEISDKSLRKSESVNGSVQKKIAEIKGIFNMSIVRQDDEINQ